MPGRTTRRVRRLLAAASLASAALASACGGSTTSPSANLPSLVSDVCNKIDQAACADPAAKQQCTPQLQQAEAQAQQTGCTAELEALLNCMNAQSVQCAPDGGIVSEPSVACRSQEQAFTNCAQPPSSQCSMLTGGSNGPACTISCSGWSASCTGTTGTLQCTCQGGAHDGATFQATGCAQGLQTAANQTCN